MGLIIRLTQSVPLMIALAVVALVVYAVVSWRRSPTRAKEVLIDVFTWLCLAIAAFFLVVTLYALFEGHTGVFDLAVSFMIVGLAGWGITRWCAHVFKKNHPHYKSKAQKATVVRRFPWTRKR